MKKHIASILFLCLLSVSQSIAQSHSIKRLGIEQGLVSHKINKASYGLLQKKDLINSMAPVSLPIIRMTYRKVAKESLVMNSIGYTLTINVPLYG